MAKQNNNDNKSSDKNKDPKLFSFPVREEKQSQSLQSNVNNKDSSNGVDEINKLKTTINESSKETAKTLATEVFEELIGQKFNLVSTPLKIIGKIGSALRGKKRTPMELIEESLDKNLDSDRNQAAGGATIVSIIIGWLAVNQSIYYIAKPFKWIGVDKVLGMLSVPLHWINAIFTPPGVPIVKTLITVNVYKGMCTISIAQGLANALLAAFNLATISLVIYLTLMSLTYIIERYRIRQIVYRAMGKNQNL